MYKEVYTGTYDNANNIIHTHKKPLLNRQIINLLSLVYAKYS